MSNLPDIITSPPKALAFDVFGTTVDWRKTVTTSLIERAKKKLDSLSSSPSSASDNPQREEHKTKLSQLTDQDWATFAQQWRNSYKQFVRDFDPSKDEWRDIDTHHHLSLISLLQQWHLDGIFSDAEIQDQSLIWHFLDPWADSSAGLKTLSTHFITTTLSNGNQSLLRDLQSHGTLGFQILQSAEDFGAYKPHASVYRGAVARMGLQMGEVAMVAAHLGDLWAAREEGMRTVYVQRRGEEDWGEGEERYVRARGWVDMWVAEGEGGFGEVARRFGL